MSSLKIPNDIVIIQHPRFVGPNEQFLSQYVTLDNNPISLFHLYYIYRPQYPDLTFVSCYENQYTLISDLLLRSFKVPPDAKSMLHTM